MSEPPNRAFARYMPTAAYSRMPKRAAEAGRDSRREEGGVERYRLQTVRLARRLPTPATGYATAARGASTQNSACKAYMHQKCRG